MENAAEYVLKTIFNIPQQYYLKKKSSTFSLGQLLFSGSAYGLACAAFSERRFKSFTFLLFITKYPGGLTSFDYPSCSEPAESGFTMLVYYSTDTVQAVSKPEWNDAGRQGTVQITPFFLKTAKHQNRHQRLTEKIENVYHSKR